MGNKVKIIAQSKFFNKAIIVEEEHAEKKLEAIKRLYNSLRLHNNSLLTESEKDNEGLLVTTTLIKE